MLLSDITSLYWSGGKPTVTCACSYETEECHGLLCYYYMFMGDDVMVTGQWTHLGHTHTHTHTHTHNVPIDCTTVGRNVWIHDFAVLWVKSGAEEWLFYNQWPSLSLFFSLSCRKNDANMSERRGRKMPSFLTSLLVSSHPWSPVSFFQNQFMVSLTLFPSLPPFSLHILFFCLPPLLHSSSPVFFFIFLFSFFLPSSKPSQQ